MPLFRRDWTAPAARLALAVLLSAVSVKHAVAQKAGPDADSVSAILAEFAAAWDDEAWGPQAGRLKEYMRPLDDVGWQARMTAFQQLAQRGASGVPELIKALASDSASVRALAAQVLGYCGNVEAVGALVQAAEHDADAMVRLYAADSLGMLGGDQEAVLRRLEPTESNRDTKRHIGYALDRAGEPVAAAVAAELRQWTNDRLGAATLGQPAPDFELTSLDGRRIRLSQYRGQQLVVLIFVYGDT